MALWKRILVVLGIAVVACGAYAWFFGVQTYYVLTARRIAREHPVVSVVPTELNELSVSSAPGKKLSYFGYEFEAPWDDVDQEQTKIVADGIATIIFHSGNGFSFWSSAPNGLISQLRSTGRLDEESLQGSLGRVIGGDAARSDYALQRAIVEATPSKLSLLISGQQAIQQSVLIQIKESASEQGADSGIYFIKTNEFRGFQYGRPQESSKPLKVTVELFSNDRHLNIRFGQKSSASATISQADINRVIQTIHRLPVESAGTTASNYFK